MFTSRRLRFIVPLLMLCPALLAAAPVRHAPAARAVAGRNLLANPGFERAQRKGAWMPADWDTSDAGLETVFFGRDTFLVHTGHYSVNLANTSTVWTMMHNWSQTLLVGPESWGKTAVFTVWTRSNGLQGRAFVLAQAFRDTITKMSQIWGIDRDEARRRLGINRIDDPALVLGWRSVQFEDAQTDWVKREARVDVPRGTNVIFVRCGLLGTGQMVFDDASLTLEPQAPAPVYKPGENLLADPGFENGADDWHWEIPPFENARIDRDSTVAHSGRVSMLCSNMRNGVSATRMGMAQAIPARGLGGKRVKISGWFKGDSLLSTAYVKVYAQGPSGMEQSPGTTLLSGTFDWTEASAELDVPRDASVLWAWLCFKAPAAGRVWLDDGSLTVVGEAAASDAPKRAGRAAR